MVGTEKENDDEGRSERMRGSEREKKKESNDLPGNTWILTLREEKGKKKRYRKKEARKEDEEEEPNKKKKIPETYP